MLHGRDVLYVVEERAPGRPPLVTDVGVRLPAHLTASGRAILAALPSAQVRALFPDRNAFVDRHGKGPTSLSALRALLAETRQRGYAAEDGEVTPGFASVAAAVTDHNDLPVAGVAVTWPSQHETVPLERLVRATRDTARRLTRRLGGNPAAREGLTGMTGGHPDQRWPTPRRARRPRPRVPGRRPVAGTVHAQPRDLAAGQGRDDHADRERLGWSVVAAVR